MAEMGLEFIDRTLRSSGIVLLIFLPFGVYYFGLFPTLAILSGAIWGMLNLMMTTALIRAFIRPGGADVARSIAWAVVKFPLLYGAGFGLLMIREFNPMHLLIGFTGVLGVMVLKALGRLLLGLDAGTSNDNHMAKTV
ncbi:MAG: hypothetical protein AB1644_04550 [Candidatus Zixiibacteriota bacterium]